VTDPRLSTRAFADRLGVVPETVRRWVRAGRITPAGRTPTGQLRFSEEQVADVLSGPASASGRAADLEAHVAASMARIRRLRRAK